jgi:hypothetical protein
VQCSNNALLVTSVVQFDAALTDLLTRHIKWIAFKTKTYCEVDFAPYLKAASMKQS